jgi:hypothetical protein
MRILADISGHGLGHLSQIAPVLVELRRRLPAMELLVRSAFDADYLQAFLRQDLVALDPAPEVGLVMRSPSVPDVDASWDAYRRLHRDWPAVVRREAEIVRAHHVNLLVGDVPYAGIVAASAAGIPAIAVCSLHWGEIIRAYFSSYPEAARIAGEIERAYGEAARFFVPAPRRRLPDLGNQESVGLLARWWGRSRRETIIARAKAAPDCKIGLISFGGIRHGLRAVQLPQDDEWLWLVPGGVSAHIHSVGRTSWLHQSELQHISHLDLLASSDLVVTKTGYSTFAECLHYGVACLFVSRPDWPEASELESHMVNADAGLPITDRELYEGDWLGKSQALLKGRGQRKRARGQGQVVDWVAESFPSFSLADATIGDSGPKTP